MPSAAATTELESFVRRMEPAQMADLLLELSGDRERPARGQLRCLAGL